jgi:hypothetical protein
MTILVAFFVIGFVGALTISGIRVYFMIDDYRMRKKQNKQENQSQIKA